MVRARYLLRSVFLLGWFFIPVRALVDVLGSGGSPFPTVLGLLLDVPVGYFLAREVLRAIQPPDTRPGVEVLAPGRPDGFDLGILVIRLLAAGFVVSIAFAIADGSWTRLLRVDGVGGAIALVGPVLGAAVLIIGFTMGLGERRTTFVAAERALRTEGPPHGETVAPLALLFGPTLFLAALRYLMPKKIDMRHVQGISVHLLVVHSRAGTSYWYTPVALIDDGTQVLAGARTSSRADAVAEARNAADRTGVTYLANPKVL